MCKILYRCNLCGLEGGCLCPLGCDRRLYLSLLFCMILCLILSSMDASHQKVIKREHMTSALVVALSTPAEMHQAFGGRKRTTKEQIIIKKKASCKMIMREHVVPLSKQLTRAEVWPQSRHCDSLLESFA